MNPSTFDWWLRSQQAADAAQEIAWAVMIFFIIVAILIWRGEK
jgi:cytochrome c1